MKKNRRKLFISIVLVVTIIMSTSAVFAGSNSISFTETTSQIEETVTAIEQDLRNDDTSIEDALFDQISELQKEKEATLDRDEKIKIQYLIDTTEELLENYISNNGSNKNIAITRANHNTVYEPAITAVIAWFAGKGYPLSAECLTYASNNNVKDVYYTPHYGAKAKSSKVILDLKKGTTTSGSSAFPNSGTALDKDLYYAIHAFRYQKNGTSIALRDRYDFAIGTYNGIAGIAVNTMFFAQEAGALVPFQISLML